jgi:hypothetical protein
MAIYPIIHKETGETKVLEMSVHDITQWYQDNPQWSRDWSQGCATPGDDVLGKAAKAPGSRVKKI